MLLRSFCLALPLVIVTPHAGAAPPADFQRDVEPIFAEHCAQCHGVDVAERKSGLRLDVRESALKGGESGTPAVVPGRPEQSELVRRISSTDADEVMPPPDHNKPLSAKEIETLKQWVLDGAKYESHWAFTPPQQAPLPQVGVTHPIDAFVLSRLNERGLTLAPAATPAALCRRLYLDLIGLPPSREQWKWRDWVVEALNADMPYDRFLVEQLAGDLLPDATQQQIIATGFLRNSMINEEGAIVPEQFRMVEMFDRLDCLGKAVLGLTTQCAQCHSHKFDPLTQEEYYGMFAFLNTSYEAQSWVYTPEQERQIAGIHRGIHEAEERLRAERPQWQPELAAWEKSLLEKEPAWERLIATELGSISGLNHPTQDADQSLLMIGHPSADVFLIAAPALDGVTGLRLEALTHRDLPHNGPGRSRLGT
ncbi:MAG: hypothetical protein B7Z73_19835, partial [Planctomycetia bacterium 21-64-5]